VHVTCFGLDNCVCVCVVGLHEWPGRGVVR